MLIKRISSGVILDGKYLFAKSNSLIL